MNPDWSDLTTAAIAAVGSTTESWCPEHGQDVALDEDGCCAVCGATATGAGARRARMLKAQVDRLTLERDAALAEIERMRCVLRAAGRVNAACADPGYRWKPRQLDALAELREAFVVFYGEEEV